MVKCSDKLLSDIKNHLGITWEDDDTDKRVAGMILDGAEKITALTGEDPSDFAQPSERKTLLKDYCRLAWAGVPEKFEVLNKSDITRLRLNSITDGGDYDE